MGVGLVSSPEMNQYTLFIMYIVGLGCELTDQICLINFEFAWNLKKEGSDFRDTRGGKKSLKFVVRSARPDFHQLRSGNLRLKAVGLT